MTEADRVVRETLTSVDALGRVQPLLAERWEAQNGGRRWQFWLRSNVQFHEAKVLSGIRRGGGAEFRAWRTMAYRCARAERR